jgi:hypothetical protein
LPKSIVSLPAVRSLRSNTRVDNACITKLLQGDNSSSKKNLSALVGMITKLLDEKDITGNALVAIVGIGKVKNRSARARNAIK